MGITNILGCYHYTVMTITSFIVELSVVPVLVDAAFVVLIVVADHIVFG